MMNQLNSKGEGTAGDGLELPHRRSKRLAAGSTRSSPSAKGMPLLKSPPGDCAGAGKRKEQDGGQKPEGSKARKTSHVVVLDGSGQESEGVSSENRRPPPPEGAMEEETTEARETSGSVTTNVTALTATLAATRVSSLSSGDSGTETCNNKAETATRTSTVTNEVASTAEGDFGAAKIMDTAEAGTLNADNLHQNTNEAANEGLAHIFEMLGSSEKYLLQLRQQGIRTVEDLLGKESELEAAQLAGVRRSIQKDLYNFCRWHKAFYGNHPSDIPWQQHFDEDSLCNFEKRLPTLEDPELLLSYAIGLLHQDDQPLISELPETSFERMYEYAADQVIDAIPDDLKKECHFSLKEYTVKWFRAIFNLPSGDPYSNIFLNSGKTQSGKSAVKAVVCAICDVLDRKSVV